ncbi:MAG: S8 family peptidase, partial [bacterium]
PNVASCWTATTARRSATASPIRFEAELWFRDSTAKRASAEQVLGQLVGELGGRVVTQCTIPEIAYHAILGELPRNAVQEIVDDPSTNLVKCDNVMFFRPVGQMSSGDKLPEGEPEEYVTPAEKPLPTREPLIAVLDGLPLANHQLLADRLVIDDPDDWASEYTAAERAHGTAMTSLIVHGDLNSNGDALRSRVYARPIMRPLIGLDRPLTECMPGDVLPVDLIHRAVRRLFEGEGDEGAVASSVKIVNLSLGDPTRAFDRAMSPLARLLDWLGRQYQVLFIISGGNCLGDIDLGMSEAEFAALSPTECEACIVKAILRDGRMRRLLSPAESINSVTVGASHRDTSQIGHMSNVLDPFLVELPSPVSPLGTGYRRSVKPDILYLGGRQLYRKPFAGEDATLPVAAHHSPPGCRVAHPGRQGQLGHTVHSAGTSNAAALVSRNAALCYEALSDVLESQAPAFASGPHVVPLLKALVVHGASWGEAGERLRQIIETDNDARQTKTLLARWLGYGVPQFNRAMQCTEERATVFGFGELEDGEAHVFRLPLPPSLGARREWRRLTVTLGWMSPIAPSTQKYRTAGLWFEAEADGLSATRTGVDWQAVRRGTVQHEVFEGERAVPVSEGDSLTIQVNCREDAGKIEQPVPYGLVVSLEVAEGVDVAIYEEVRTRIAVPVHVRQTAVGNDS